LGPWGLALGWITESSCSYNTHVASSFVICLHDMSYAIMTSERAVLLPLRVCNPQLVQLDGEIDVCISRKCFSSF
jgi:hypothetical protein